MLQSMAGFHETSWETLEIIFEISIEFNVFNDTNMAVVRLCYWEQRKCH